MQGLPVQQDTAVLYGNLLLEFCGDRLCIKPGIDLPQKRLGITFKEETTTPLENLSRRLDLLRIGNDAVQSGILLEVIRLLFITDDHAPQVKKTMNAAGGKLMGRRFPKLLDDRNHDIPGSMTTKALNKGVLGIDGRASNLPLP